jgi:signal transduction histidine kinase
MSAHAAIAPAAGIQARRLPVGRMVVVTVAYLAIIIGAAVYPFVSPLHDEWFPPVSPLEKFGDALLGVVWLVVLLVSLARQPHGRLWKLIFVAFTLQRIGTLMFVPNSLVWSLARIAEQVGVGVFVQLLLAFPSGYLRDRFDRVVVGLGYTLGVAWALNELLFVGNSRPLGCNPDCVQNVLIVLPNEELYNWLRNAIAVAFSLIVLPLVIAALWRHWRAAAPAARRALLPLVVGVPLWIAVGTVEILSRELDFAPGIAFFDSPSGRAIHLIAPLIFPVGLLVGMVRTRWSRGRVASLVVELGRGVPVGGLRDVLARALDDPSLELAFAAPSGSGFVDASGQPVELPVGDATRTVTRLERGDELLGVLIHDPAIEAEDPGLVEAVGNAARLALENERLAAEVRAQLEEVRASRTRIVEAADAERRRVERDLHDGAQQRLVALALRLQVASKTTPEAAALLEEATGELQTAIGEVRGLARGVHPTILTEVGLRAAVDALAERTPLPVTVDIPERRFDPTVEATAYFVVAEALTNIARYADAGEARVVAVPEDNRLVVTVEDDGRGGADPTQGSGLRGLADRLAAIEGRLTITSPEGRGTTVRAELPLAVPDGSAMSTPVSADPSALARVRAVPEAGAVPRLRGRVRLSSPVFLMASAAVAIAVVALAAAVPLFEERPIPGRADDFIRPFDYIIPAGSNVRLDRHTDHLQVFISPGDRLGLSIWAVDEVLVDHCPPLKPAEPPGAVRPRQPGVDGLLAYLRSVEGLHVSPMGYMSIDQRLAVRVDLAVGMDVVCPAGPRWLYLWRDTSPRGDGVAMQVGGDGWLPLAILDVDGQTIVFELWGAEDWGRSGEKIVNSIRFAYRPPLPSPASPTRAP